VLIGAMVAWFSAREAFRTPLDPYQTSTVPKPVSRSNASHPAFDFYLLALSLHPAFCADGHGQLPECRGRAPRALSIHGLWPEKLQPGAYPHDCPAPGLDLEPALAQELAEFMPGMSSDLHDHEWRKHGGCSGLDDDVYFRRALELTREVDSALSARLTILAGEETTARELREYADEFHPGLGATLTFHCRTLRDGGGQPFLVEMRQCVDDDGPGGAPGTLLDCARVERRDQGCGGSFRIAGERMQP
jgi:ribonuclease T2